MCGSGDYIAKRLFAPNLIKPPGVEIARVGLVYVSNLTEQALHFLSDVLLNYMGKFISVVPGYNGT